ncbi:MAG: transposase [Candidatus Thiodiazotropha sp.]
MDLQEGYVLDVVGECTEKSYKQLIEQSLSEEQRQQVTAVALDMWKAYANAVEERLPQADWAERHFDKWYSWAIRSRLEPIKKEARMIKKHLPNILNYFKHRISHAVAEGLNSKIQTVKANTRGYRSFDGFRNSILFYCGGLDMRP